MLVGVGVAELRSAGVEDARSELLNLDFILDMDVLVDLVRAPRDRERQDRGIVNVVRERIEHETRERAGGRITLLLVARSSSDGWTSFHSRE